MNQLEVGLERKSKNSYKINKDVKLMIYIMNIVYLIRWIKMEIYCFYPCLYKVNNFM